MAFSGDALCELAAQFLALAEKQTATAPFMVGHRVMGASLLFSGDIAQGRAHFDQALALYDPAEHRPLATRFGQDVRVSILSFRSVALWVLGYPETALVDAERTLKDAREIGQAATLMYALSIVPRLIAGEVTTSKQKRSQKKLSHSRKRSAFYFGKGWA